MAEASSHPQYVFEDLGLTDMDDYFHALSERMSKLKNFFSEVYFLSEPDECISYTGSDDNRHQYQFKCIEIPVTDEELIKIRDNVYDRGGDPNRIVLGVYRPFEHDFTDTSVKTNIDDVPMKASYFVKC